MLIAMSVSVTVSIGELIKGVFNVIFFVILESSETAEAGKSMYPGRIRKSLYVSPPWTLESMSSAAERPSGENFSRNSSVARLQSRGEDEDELWPLTPLV